MMITMKMGMSSTRMKRRYESTPMTKVEEEDEECISSPHAPQSTTPKGNERWRRLLMAKAFPDAEIWRKRPVYALDEDRRRNVAPDHHPASLKNGRGPTMLKTPESTECPQVPDWTAAAG